MVERKAEMTRQSNVTIAGGLLLLVTATLHGCCMGRIDLCREGGVSIAGRPSDKVEILWADVWQTDEEVLVYAALRRRAYTRCPMKVDVDVMVTGPDGAVLEETRLSEVRIPARCCRRMTCWERFRAPLAAVPPTGSKVIISVHDA
jgi:hypothetical protein